ncbi:MAG: ABC transporter permease [Elusimicrobia bacterium]|nr:ABC transporter permease [Elusimicrobiota bacterium]
MTVKSEIRNILHLALKDVRAYYFKPATISWGILFPLVFVLIFSLKNPAGFPSMLGGLFTMAIFFGTTSMTATSIMLERKTGVFNVYYTFPISYCGIVLGKILAGFLFGIFTTLSICAITLFFVKIRIFNAGLLILWVILSSFAFSSFGLFLSLIVKEAYDAMTYMNLIRLPLIFVSGIFLPVSSLTPTLKIFAYLSPMTYSVNLAEASILNRHFIGVSISFIVLATVGVLFTALAAVRVEKLRD